MDRTVLSFEDGITGVVGPNGCGKSNIVDAIFWVMGEQSAKHLRGNSMEDVIFNGSDNNIPLGMAEVTLVLSNPTTPGPQPDERAQYLKYSEIEVTRRLYRSGESEYLINKTHCRLRDILDLFMDTGVGTKAYSIIEQGQIAKMISAKPEDRRAIIEEAAGITKYKARKKESLRKIESTQQNLLRINDIVIELEKQLKHLQRQAKKAGDYKGVKERAKFLDLVLSSKKYNSFLKLREVKQKAFQEVQEKFLSSKTDFQSVESQIEERRVKLIDEEKKLSNRQQRTYELEADIQRKEQIKALKTQELEATSQFTERAGSEISELHERLIRSQRAKEVISHQEIELGKEFSERCSELKSFEKSLQAFREELFCKEKEFEELKTKIHGSITETNRCRQWMEHHKERIFKNGERRELVEKELQVQERFQITEEKEIFNNENNLKEFETKKGTFDERREDLEDKITTYQANLENENSILENAKEELTHIRSTIQNLEEFQKRFEGYQAGVRELMLRVEKKGRYLLLGDLFDVEPGYEKAAEAACAERLQQIVVESSSDALEALEFLHQGNKGRASFIPKEWVKETPREIPLLNGLQNLRQKVRVSNPSLKSIVDGMFNNIFLVDSIESATSIRNKLPLGLILVTRDGDLLSSDGVISGGSEDPFVHQLVTKKREIDQLKVKEIEKSRDLQTIKDKLNSISIKLKEAESSLEELFEEEHNIEIDMVDCKSKLEHQRRHSQRIKERIDELGKELKTLKEEDDKLESELADFRIKFTDSETKRKIDEQRLDDLQNLLAKLKEDVISKEQYVTELKIKVASLLERKNSLLSQIEKTDNACSEIELKLATHQKEITESDQKRVELIQQIESTKFSILEMVKGHEEEKRGLTEARRNYESLMTGLRQFEEQSKGFRSSFEKLNEDVSQSTIQLQELKLELQRIEEQIQERYFLNLFQVYEQYINEQIDEQEATEELEIVRNKLRRMGEVNTSAIEEFEEVQKRHTFLQIQRDDLQESITRLEKTIEKINRVSRKRFEAAYAAVNDKFQKVFPMLFGGGKAELTLSNPENLLESGVEILAKPPGKKLQNINLLSGGEKALTSVSLIFSIFLIKPSPFCLLDEVDAPLDDANIGRFNEMVKHMSTQSQFILITHNKRTMEIADVLYGVTMEQPGISKLVSVVLSGAKKLIDREVMA